MLGLPSSEKLLHCNCNEQGNCLNMTICAATTGVDSVSVVAYNPLGQASAPWIRLPVTGPEWQVSDSTGFLPSQTSLLDARTLSLPLLYLNKFGLDTAQIATRQAELKNNATHVLEFRAALPPMGYSVFTLKKVASMSEPFVANAASVPAEADIGSGSVNNSYYQIDYSSSGIISITNLESGDTTPFAIEWGFYRSSEGGCSGGVDPATGKYSYDYYGCDSQASGAYMFRPNSSNVYPCGNSTPTLTVAQGPLVTEITQTYSSWCTHVLRLRKGDPMVEVEWTAGPIPLDQDWIPKPPPPPPPTNQCQGWVGLTGKLSCNASIAASLSGSCHCAGGLVTVEGGKHAAFTCDEACAGQACAGAGSGWKQTANCGTGPDSANDKPCDAPLPGFASGYCQCSMGRTVGKDWSNNGCNVDKGGNCDQLCASSEVKKDFWGKELIMKYKSGLRTNGVFYTDANGREMMKR